MAECESGWMLMGLRGMVGVVYIRMRRRRNGADGGGGPAPNRKRHRPRSRSPPPLPRPAARAPTNPASNSIGAPSIRTRSYRSLPSPDVRPCRHPAQTSPVLAGLGGGCVESACIGDGVDSSGPRADPPHGEPTPRTRAGSPSEPPALPATCSPASTPHSYVSARSNKETGSIQALPPLALGWMARYVLLFSPVFIHLERYHLSHPHPPLTRASAHIHSLHRRTHSAISHQRIHGWTQAGRQTHPSAPQAARGHDRPRAHDVIVGPRTHSYAGTTRTAHALLSSPRPHTPGFAVTSASQARLDGSGSCRGVLLPPPPLADLELCVCDLAGYGGRDVPAKLGARPSSLRARCISGQCRGPCIRIAVRAPAV